MSPSTKYDPSGSMLSTLPRGFYFGWEVALGLMIFEWEGKY